MRGDGLIVRTKVRKTYVFWIKKGGISTKSIDKKVRIVFWIGFWASIVLCLAAWIMVYLHQALDWPGMLNGEHVIALLAITVTTAMYLFIYHYYVRK